MAKNVSRTVFVFKLLNIILHYFSNYKTALILAILSIRCSAILLAAA